MDRRVVWIKLTELLYSATREVTTIIGVTVAVIIVDSSNSRSLS